MSYRSQKRRGCTVRQYIDRICLDHSQIQLGSSGMPLFVAQSQKIDAER